MYDIQSLTGGKKKPVENEYIRFDKLSALVIDDIGAMRHAIRSQLQSLGMNSISVTGDPNEALRQLEIHPFDLIVCDYNLNNASSGQHFLEYLRQEGQLSALTVFVMVTAEAEYSFVASAVEFVPDDYILKPCPEKKLRMRLERLFDRRAFLLPVLKALDAQDYALAIAESDRLIGDAPQERWVMDALRRKAEAQQALNDPAILATYEQARAIRESVPWVNMGLARMYFAQGDLPRAETLVRELLAGNANYVAAYELLGQIRQTLGDDEAAFDALLASSRILPSARRFRSISDSAFLLGKFDQSKEYTESAIRLSKGSMVERSDDYLALAQTQVDMGDGKGAIQTLEKSAQKYPEAGLYGVSKNAILAQAYFDTGERDKARKLVERSQRLLSDRVDSATMTFLGKAALKVGDQILGLKLLTQAVQASGQESGRISRHVAKSMKDTGHADKVEDVIDGGQRRILRLVEDANRAMRGASFQEAYERLQEAFAIHDENIEALLAAAQLHLLWLKQTGANEAIADRARYYLATLDRLVPNNPKVMGFYKFFYEIVGR
jgi:CheY-like chemotaxis protein